MDITTTTTPSLFARLFKFLSFVHEQPTTAPAPATAALTVPSPAPVETANAKPADISPQGLEMVKHFESLFLTAYYDGGGALTIGYGHTGLQHKDGTVYPGRRITEQEAVQLLAYDMNQFESRVKALVTVPLNQAQFDSLVSFDFNTGGLTLRGRKPSTLLRKLNAGDTAGAAQEFLKWNKDNGKIVDGLTRRRYAEREMFLGRDWRKFTGAGWKKQIAYLTLRRPPAPPPENDHD